MGIFDAKIRLSKTTKHTQRGQHEKGTDPARGRKCVGPKFSPAHSETAFTLGRIAILTKTKRMLCATLLVLADFGLVYFGSQIGFLDGRPYYSPATVGTLLNGLASAGRALYLRIECGDLVFIAGYVSFSRHLLHRPHERLAVGIAAAADLLETGGTIAHILVFPRTLGILPWAMCIATPIKWAALLTFVFLSVRQNSSFRNPRSCL